MTRACAEGRNDEGSMTTELLVAAWPVRQRGFRRGASLLSFARRFAIGVTVGYILACAVLYGAQRYLVFEPDRTLHAMPADYPFPVQDVAVSGEPGQTLDGWWIPSAR